MCCWQTLQFDLLKFKYWHDIVNTWIRIFAMFPCRISSHVLRASTAQSISTSSSRRTNHENNKDDIISHSRGVLWNLLLRQKKVEESFCKISFLYSMHKLPKCTHQFFLLFPRKFHRKQSYFHWILQMITMLSGILCHNRCWHQYPNSVTRFDVVTIT